MSAVLEAVPKRRRPDPVAAEDADEGVQPFRWNVKDYYRAIKSGALEHPERLELIDGEIFEKVAAQETPHCTSTLLTRDALAEAFGPSCHVRSQMPVDVSQRTEPEPDVFVVAGKTRDYEHRKPRVEDIKLIVEVADTTLGYDRHRKAARYAEAGIADYWIVNLAGRCVEVYRDPAPMPDSRFGFGYKTSIRCGETETVSPLMASGALIRVAELLPSPATDPET